MSCWPRKTDALTPRPPTYRRGWRSKKKSPTYRRGRRRGEEQKDGLECRSGRENGIPPKHTAESEGRDPGAAIGDVGKAMHAGRGVTLFPMQQSRKGKPVIADSIPSVVYTLGVQCGFKRG